MNNDNSLTTAGIVLPPEVAFSPSRFLETKLAEYSVVANDNTKELKEKVAERLSNVPEEQIVEPSLRILIPALVSNSYVDDETLRECYVNLISNSMLKDKQDLVHPAFEIFLRQLSQTECILLAYMAVVLGINNALPIIELRWKSKGGGYLTKLSDLYLCPHEVKIEDGCIVELTNIRKGNAGYISNLSHLGLIERTYFERIHEKARYKPLKNLAEVIANADECAKSGYEFEIVEGLAKLTPLGRDFTNVCCSFGNYVKFDNVD